MAYTKSEQITYYLTTYHTAIAALNNLLAAQEDLEVMGLGVPGESPFGRPLGEVCTLGWDHYHSLMDAVGFVERQPSSFRDTLP